MIPAYPPFGSSSFKMVAKGLIALHALGKAGKDESPEADSVRDSLDLPLAALNRIEKERAQWLSEDLYSVSEPSSASQKEMNPQAQQQLSEAIEARLKGEWDLALKILRNWQEYVAPPLLSYMRGSIWMGAGNADVAAMFYGHASECEPANESYQHLHLKVLYESDPVCAGERVSQILAEYANYSPALVYCAADIRFSKIEEAPFAESAQLCRDLMQILEINLARVEKQEAADSASATRQNCVMLLGCCNEFLGNINAAVVYFSLGLKMNPSSDALLTARGTLLYGANPYAIADLEQAVQLGTPLIWPYFFLAHHHLTAGQFHHCRIMCEAGLKLKGSDTAKSQLEEWRAIAQAELGFPPELVRMAFEAAIRLDPTNESAKRNQDAYEVHLKSPHSDLRSIWEQKSNSAIRQFGLAERRYSLAA